MLSTNAAFAAPITVCFFNRAKKLQLDILLYYIVTFTENFSKKAKKITAAKMRRKAAHRKLLSLSLGKQHSVVVDLCAA
ncbi:MAG: hypothetical protein K2O14_09335, partial [Oscillospiraceae bacterium]|nr:hypothetical protein [Oscillospiraceae bacterium]